MDRYMDRYIVHTVMMHYNKSNAVLITYETLKYNKYMKLQ
jgi:hypothetical protein